MNQPKVVTIDAVRVVVLALALVVAAVSVQAQADPFIGTWRLNLEKSQYSPGPPPRAQVSLWAPKGKGVKITTTGIGADGKPTSQDTTAQYDGKDYPTIGNPDYDTASFKRIDANTLQVIRKRDGTVVQTATFAVSTDGKTRTITTKGTNVLGQTINNVSVYERQ
jgi:outer membrane lipoprotein-sorting protein